MIKTNFYINGVRVKKILRYGGNTRIRTCDGLWFCWHDTSDEEHKKLIDNFEIRKNINGVMITTRKQHQLSTRNNI